MKTQLQESEKDFVHELKDRIGNILILNVSGLVALMLIGEESGVSCCIGSTHTQTKGVVFTLCDRRAWGG